ncbi:MAG: segregation/condensation protein A [Actinobacteria bacterium]|nr:segregation/condensation protein A [Actinomycetota bacterium]
MTYEVTTPVFEGPLELLLQLITSRRVEITEISLSDLVEEYLSYLELMREFDMEITSEFLLIAATLIQLKARRLLPDDAEVDLDEELALAYERDRLLSRLLACLTFKDVAAVFAHRFDAQRALVPRTVGLDPGVHPAPPEVVLPVSAIDLAVLAGAVIGRRREPDVDHLDLDLPSVALAIEDVRHRLAADVEADFDALTEHCTRPVEVIAYFLAVLELARWGLVKASQEHLEAAIRVRRLEGAEVSGDAVSEWGG